MSKCEPPDISINSQSLILLTGLNSFYSMSLSPECQYSTSTPNLFISGKGQEHLLSSLGGTGVDPLPIIYCLSKFPPFLNNMTKNKITRKTYILNHFVLILQLVSTKQSLSTITIFSL